MKKQWLCSLLLLCSSIISAGQLVGVDAREQAGHVILQFKTQGKMFPEVFLLKQPERLVIDFKQSAEPGLNLSKLEKGVIKTVRPGRPQKDTYRLVFDLTKPIEFKKDVLPADSKGRQGFRLELITQQEKPAFVQKTFPPIKKHRDVIIAIDPGHGGKDPGARGPGGAREKDVVLKIALKLQRLINKQPGMKAVMTRSGDYYIGLRERLRLARKHDADIFVSIHADAFKNKDSKGASVFALSPRGATSEAARWLAEKENHSELGGVDLSDLDDDNGVVRSVLIDLSQTATIGASLTMGQEVLKNLDRLTTLHNDQVEQARFVVLKSPDIPSILVETGFISNPREEKNLRSSWYQKRLSDAVFQGIKAYFWQHPPYGSYIEAMLEKKIHIVKSGETLSGLAADYHISIGQLRQVNKLTSNSLKIGQKIIIPAKKWA